MTDLLEVTINLRELLKQDASPSERVVMQQIEALDEPEAHPPPALDVALLVAETALEIIAALRGGANTGDDCWHNAVDLYLRCSDTPLRQHMQLRMSTPYGAGTLGLSESSFFNRSAFAFINDPIVSDDIKYQWILELNNFVRAARGLAAVRDHARWALAGTPWQSRMHLDAALSHLVATLAASQVPLNAVLRTEDRENLRAATSSLNHRVGDFARTHFSAPQHGLASSATVLLPFTCLSGLFLTALIGHADRLDLAFPSSGNTSALVEVHALIDRFVSPARPEHVPTGCQDLITPGVTGFPSSLAHVEAVLQLAAPALLGSQATVAGAQVLTLAFDTRGVILLEGPTINHFPVELGTKQEFRTEPWAAWIRQASLPIVPAGHRLARDSDAMALIHDLEHQMHESTGHPNARLARELLRSTTTALTAGGTVAALRILAREASPATIALLSAFAADAVRAIVERQPPSTRG